jgi:hypothetical protein
MPTIADFHVIDAGSHTFAVPEPNPWSPAEVIEYAFSAPAADAGTMSILFFRLHPEGQTDCRVEMFLNGTEIFSRTLTPGFERSMHVAIPRGLVHATNNTLSVSKVEGGVVLTVSELILFFQAAIA